MPAWLAWLIFIPLALLCAAPSAQRARAWLGGVIDRAARMPLGVEAVVFLVALALGMMPTFLDAVPPPSTHDEFSYLLAADTFAQGRLTNPPHPLWEHFETFHQIMQPTYASKFPPAQGAALCVGQLLGHPIVGAWGTIALACAAIAWMLRAVLPPRWALVGGLLAATHPLLLWWGQIYWGGGVALLGGAVLGGAILRTLGDPRVRWGISAGIGIAILANSRPFEGALVSALILALASVVSLRRGHFGLLVRRVVLPIALILLPVGAWMMYYNWRVTGSPVTMPYVVHARQYMMSPLLWFESPPPKPQYRHAKLEHYYHLHEFREFDEQRSFDGFVRGAARKGYTLTTDVLNPPTLALALLGLASLLPGRRKNASTADDSHFTTRRAARWALAMCLVFPLAHVLLTPWFRIQYSAPMLGFFFLLAGASMLWMWRWRSGRIAIGAGMVSAVLIVQVMAVLWTIHQMARNPHPTGQARARLVADRMNMPGQHLVIVMYAPGPQSLFEWVYNSADIDASKVVFAHSIDEQSDRRLLEYFRGRRVWLLRVQGLRYEVSEVLR